MKAIAAGLAGALISGVAMYTVGAGDALGQSLDTQMVPATYATALRPIAAPEAAVVTPVRNTTTARRAPARQRTVYRAPVQEREIVRDEREIVREDDRSWGKTAMVIGGSAAGGAGVGGIVGGKKGALIGAAIGGGAASIYEATQRK